MTKDAKYAQALLQMIGNSDLHIKGKELSACVEIINWINGLDSRLNPAPKPIEEKPEKKKTKKKAK